MNHIKFTEGKTKVIYTLQDPKLCLVENKNAITANDDPERTRYMDNKPKHATATTCRVFELLQAAGIPVAFVQQDSETMFIAPRCTMIALECIARREADGSYLKRFPNLQPGEGRPSKRFHRLVTEFFLKTTGGRIAFGEEREALMPVDSLDPEGKKKVDDPLIINPTEMDWNLCHPKIPTWDPRSTLGVSVLRQDVLPESVSLEQLDTLTRQTFLVLEKAWGMLGCKLIDFKIEFGVDHDGNLLVADVIDNDSWRLRTSDGHEVSKQLFRDGHPLAEVEEKYALVAHLTERFRIPKQAILVWRGSESDTYDKKGKVVSGVDILDFVGSAHKKPEVCLRKLEEVLALYPDGGVIIAAVGMSNGLGPMLAARTSWPVLGVSMTAGNDIWSNLRLPSYVPMATYLSVENAAMAAFNILALSNPAAYAWRQYAIEELDL